MHASVGKLLARARREVDEGLLPAAQIALAKNGEVQLLETFGAADDDALFCMFSATKAVTSAAAWLLLQDGVLQESTRVAELIPEFGQNGKDQVTVGQLFTHTAGFPYAPFRPLDWVNPARRLERFAQWRLNWPPGSRYEYHPTSGMWVIAELIERLSGSEYVDYVRACVTGPLGLANLIVGLEGAADNARALDCEFVGEALTAADYEAMGMAAPPATEVNEETILRFNDADVRAVGVPGGGGFANAADLALFYQALLHGGLGDTEIWTPEILASARRIRTGDLKDPYFGQLANRGLGIIIAGDDARSFRGFGKTNSPETFGHNGAGGQLAWVDPATGISLAYLTNGHDRNEVRQARRGVAIGSLAAVAEV
jgi:CubicO group peptidase (beta-lactamase class C family)